MSILSNDGGFTLFEVLVAFLFTVIALLGVFQLQSQSIHLGARAQFNQVAPGLAGQKVADVLQSGGTESEQGDFGEDFPGYQWQVALTQVSSELLEETARRLHLIDVWVRADAQAGTFHLQTAVLFDEEP